MAQLPRRYRAGKDLLSQLHEDFDRMLLAPFDLRSNLGWAETSVSDWVPTIDVKEEEKQYLIHADIPGVKASDIDVSMENGVLTIKGQRKTEVKESKANFLRVERSSGSFMRQLVLPESIDQAHIQAKCRDGVLEVVLPKAAHSAGHKINVQGD